MSRTSGTATPSGLQPGAPPGSGLDAEALIEEARARQRRRRRRVGATVLAVTLAGLLALGLAEVLPGRGTESRADLGDRVGPVAGHQRPAASLVGAQWRTPGMLQAVSCVDRRCVSVGEAGASVGFSPGVVGEAHAQVLVSTDGGQRWVPGAAPSGAVDLAGVACGGSGWCLAVGQGPPQAVSPALAASLPAPLQKYQFVAWGLAFVSHDGGAHWSPVPLPARTAPLVSLSCWSAGSCVAVGALPVVLTRGSGPGAGAVGAVAVPAVVALVTTDGGAHWASLALPVRLLRATALACGPAGRCLLAGQSGPPGSPSPVVLASSDGATAWHLEPPPSLPAGPLAQEPSPALLTAVACPGAGRCVAWGVVPDGGPGGQTLLVTSDGGASWSVASGGRVPRRLFLSEPGRLAAVDCPTSERCVATLGEPGAGGPEAVLVSEDGGASWQLVPPQADRLAQATTALACQAGGSCVAVGATTTSPAQWLAAAWTSDPAGSWQPATVPVALASLRAVACFTARRCVAGGAADDGAGVALVSSDGGTSWRAATLPVGTPPLQAVWCAADGQCLGVADLEESTAGRFEVLVSGDAGRVWTEQAGSPHRGALIALSCRSLRVCWALVGTEGDSSLVFGRVLALRTTDGGTRWTTVSLPAGLEPGSLALSCPSSRFCLALAPAFRTAAGQVVVALVDRHGSLFGRVVGRLRRGWGAHSLLCLSTQRCLAAGQGPGWSSRGIVLLSTDAGAHWRLVTEATRYQGVEALACPTSRRCVGVGNGPPLNGAGVLAGPPAPSRWRMEAIPGGVGKLVAVSCLTSDDCVAVGTVPGGAVVLVSQDAGRRWQPAAMPTFVEEPLLGPLSR